MRYGQGVDDAEIESGTRSQELPGTHVTINQIVAMNLRRWRLAAGLTQEELGERLGWSKVIVSAAERSATGRRVRHFSADDLVALAHALGIPLLALFLPPPEDGSEMRYLFHAGPDCLGMTELVEITLPDNAERTDVMDAYRMRLFQAAGRYLDTEWNEDVRQWMEGETASAVLRDRAARLRQEREMLRDTIGDLGRMADAYEAMATHQERQ